MNYDDWFNDLDASKSYDEIYWRLLTSYDLSLPWRCSVVLRWFSRCLPEIYVWGTSQSVIWLRIHAPKLATYLEKGEMDL